MMLPLKDFYLGILYGDPSFFMGTVPLVCCYLGMRDLSGAPKSSDSSCLPDTFGYPGELKVVYSRFRPQGLGAYMRVSVDVSEEPEGSSERGAGGTGTVFRPVTVQPSSPITHRFSLDSLESFSYLHVCARLIERAGLSALYYDVTEDYVRLWREWLDSQSKLYPFRMLYDNSSDGNTDESGDNDAAFVQTEPAEASSSGDSDTSNILWVGTNQDIGLKLHVQAHAQIDGDDITTVYELEIEGRLSVT